MTNHAYSKDLDRQLADSSAVPWLLAGIAIGVTCCLVAGSFHRP